MTYEQSPNDEAALARALRRWEGEGGALARAMGARLGRLFQLGAHDRAEPEDDVIRTLRELLAAGQGAIGVATLTAREVRGEVRKLLLAIRRDEVRACAVLSRSLQRAGAGSSNVIGKFCEKAMAIRDPQARLAFFNRGERWKVYRLERLMPEVSETRLRDELGHIHQLHVENIRRMDLVLSKFKPAARARI